MSRSTPLVQRPMIDGVDRAIINALQGGFPISSRPYADAAASLGLAEGDLMARLDRLLRDGVLSRCGPMYNAVRRGGAFCLGACAVPPEGFEQVVATINAHPEVAHNYERGHALNVWFVLASDRPERIDEVVTEIKSETGLEVYAFPKLEEYFIGLRIEA